jgi:GNAT superfamily N-acetyltransferase
VTPPPAFQLIPADRLPPRALHSTLVAAFADYVGGPLTMALAQWPDFLARQAVDLRLSRVAIEAGAPVALAFVAPRPRHARWRLATMGARPAARGGGAAKLLLDDLIERARQAGQNGVELEVFAQNPRALALYEGRGFQRRHALHGWTAGAAPAGVGGAADAVHRVDRETALAWLDEADERLPDLPLQMLPPVLATVGVPLHAWRLGSAQVVWSRPPDGPATLLSLVDRVPAQRDAQQLVGTLWQSLDDRAGAPRSKHDPGIRVPPLLRPDTGGLALARLGFQRTPLSQWWMAKRL